MRQRGSGSWEFRVYMGTDPESGKRRYATRTVRGTKRAAQRALVELADDVGNAIVAARLSHARASTTLNVYAHAVAGGDRAAAETPADPLRDGPECETL